MIELIINGKKITPTANTTTVSPFNPGSTQPPQPIVTTHLRPQTTLASTTVKPAKTTVTPAKPTTKPTSGSCVISYCDCHGGLQSLSVTADVTIYAEPESQVTFGTTEGCSGASPAAPVTVNINSETDIELPAAHAKITVFPKICEQQSLFGQLGASCPQSMASNFAEANSI